MINEDLSIDVDSNVRIDNFGLEYLPLKFNKVEGFFSCYDNKLLSLEGSPKIINGNFICYNNKLNSLEYSPEKINGNFDISFNNLQSIKNNIIYIENGILNLRYNKIKSIKIEHLPKMKDNVTLKLQNNPIYILIPSILNEVDFELLREFDDYSIVRGDRLYLNRLKAFISDFNLKMPDLDDFNNRYDVVY